MTLDEKSHYMKTTTDEGNKRQVPVPYYYQMNNIFQANLYIGLTFVSQLSLLKENLLKISEKIYQDLVTSGL